MKIENKIRKRIKTIAIVNHEYPKEIEITRDEYNKLQAECSKITTNFNTFIKELDENNQPLTKFDGVKLKIIEG